MSNFRGLAILSAYMFSVGIAHAGDRWTGFYGGVNVGRAATEHDTVRNTGTDNGIGGFGTGLRNGSYPRTFDLGSDGIAGGAQAGYNLQLGVAVIGVEADIQAVDADDSVRVAGKPPFVPATFTASRSLEWLGTVRGRLGITPQEGWLIYGTGGLAYGKTELGVNFRCPTCGPPANITGETSDTQTGWTVGGGAEVALTEHISLKGEYLYYDLGDSSNTIRYTYGPNTSTLTTKSEDTGSLVRAGLNYKF